MCILFLTHPEAEAAFSALLFPVFLLQWRRCRVGALQSLPDALPCSCLWPDALPCSLLVPLAGCCSGCVSVAVMIPLENAAGQEWASVLACGCNGGWTLPERTGSVHSDWGGEALLSPQLQPLAIVQGVYGQTETVVQSPCILGPAHCSLTSISLQVSWRSPRHGTLSI